MLSLTTRDGLEFFLLSPITGGRLESLVVSLTTELADGLGWWTWVVEAAVNAGNISRKMDKVAVGGGGVLV